MAEYNSCYSFCTDCRKWVPVEYMNYFDGMRVCDWCLNQEQEKPPHNKFVRTPNYGGVQCVMCDSYDTGYIEGTHPEKYKCRECGEEFIL